MPVQTPVKPAQNTSSPLEISTLQKNLAAHQSAVSQKLATSLEAKIRQSLPKIVSGVDQGIISRLAAEIAAESSRDILENIAKINNFNEANTVIADSLTQSIVAHPELDGKLKTNEGKIFAGLLKETQDVAQTHQNDLAKAAVLGSMVNIARLEKPDEQLRSLVIGAVDQAVAARMPLARPEVNRIFYGHASGFLQNYLGNLNARIQPQLSQGKIPDFASYQSAKSAAFKDTAQEFAKNVKFKGRIDPTDITNRIGFILGLDPSQVQFSSVGQAKGVNAFMMRMVLATNKGREEFDNALISHDRSWLEKNYARARAQVEKFKKQRSLTYKDRKTYLLAQKNLASLGKAMTFRAKNEQRAKNWMLLVQSITVPSGGHNLTLAYQAAITSREAAMGNFPGVYAPRSLAGNSTFMARNTLSLLSPKLGLGDLFGSLKESFMSPQNLGMGISITSQAAAGLGLVSAAKNLARRVTLGLAGLWGGMLLYMMFLGKAALMGFLIGSAAGATAGGVAGAVIPVAMLGPAGMLLWPVTIPLGIAAGGVVGGIIGALIGYGLTSGSTTAVTMGVGAGVGGTVGAVTGGIIGGALFGAIPVVGPILAPLGVVLGASIGAVVGSFVGAAIGYVIGHYVIGTIGVPASGALAGAAIGFYFGGPPGALVGAGIGWLLAGGWSQIKDFLTGATNLGAGATTGVAGFVGNLASTVWGGLTGGTAGALIGFYVAGPIGAVIGGAIGFFAAGGLRLLNGIITQATGAGVLSGFGSLVTGLASTVWGGIITGAGASFGFISGAASFLVGGLGSLSIPTFVIAVPVFGGLGAITIGSIIVGITTATSFFSTDKEISGLGNADNAYFKIEKSASPTQLTLPDSKVTFTINLTVKDTNLVEITITDDKVTIDGQNKHFEITQNDQGHLLLADCNTPPPTDLAAHATWSCSFTINSINNDYTDTLVVNTVTVTAKPEGQSDTVTGSASARVKIGNPPLTDPMGWPTCGYISQGSYSSGTHQGAFASAIDINDPGNLPGAKVYATHSGTVIDVSYDSTGSFNIGIRGDNYITYYVHLVDNSNTVNRNDWVDAGTYIGLMDATGAYAKDVDGNPIHHLHYMIWDLNSNPILKDLFNSLLPNPNFDIGDTVTSSWGPC